MTRFLAIIVAVLGVSAVQVIVKYRFNAAHGPVPADGTLYAYVARLLADPWLWSAAIVLVGAALLWYFALSRLPLSVAIAFASLVYPTVILASVVMLGETVRLAQAAGCGMIVAGIWLIAAWS